LIDRRFGSGSTSSEATAGHRQRNRRETARFGDQRPGHGSNEPSAMWIYSH
jgi:hypothetical protein